MADLTGNDFQKRARETWAEAVEAICGTTAPSSLTWTDPDSIINALSFIMGSNRNHSHLPDGGGFDFVNVTNALENGCIDFHIQGGSRCRVKPLRLHLERISSDLAQSFFLLELDSLAPSDIFADGAPEEGEGERVPIREELVEIPARGYFSRDVWEDGELPDGESLPEDARIVVRYTGGKLLFVTKGSIWNGSPSTYDGRHAFMTASELRRVIEDVLSRRSW